jgi:hypothetical protein
VQTTNLRETDIAMIVKEKDGLPEGSGKLWIKNDLQDFCRSDGGRCSLASSSLKLARSLL